jgi:CMP-N-acetylneuraminic acid synthetase
VKILAVIPARAGSKRFPGKNLAKLDGQTLVERAIRCVTGIRDWRQTFTLCVSTDSEQIVDEALRVCPEITIVMRPPELAQGEPEGAGGWPAGMVAPGHALGIVPGPFDGVLLLQPTSPLRTCRHIKLALETFAVTSGRNSVISCCGGDYAIGRDNGAIYLANATRFLATKSWGYHNALWLMMSAAESIDVDCELDLLWARDFLQQSNSRRVEVSTA